VTIDNAKELKAKLLEQMHEEIDRMEAGTEGLRQPRPEARIAVGFSRLGKGISLQVRVQRKSGPAWRRAHEINEKYPNEVHVSVVQSIEVPPSRDVREHPASQGSKGRPLRLGSSVSHVDDSSVGCLGAFVLDEDDRRSILSCSHVLALSGKAQEDDIVISPGRSDLRSVDNSHKIGLLSGFKILTRGGVNESDAAYARLNDGVDLLGNVIPKDTGAPSQIGGKAVKFKALLPSVWVKNRV